MNPFSMHQIIPDLTYGSPMFNSPNGYHNPLSPALTPPAIYANTWVVPSPQPTNGQFLFPSNVMPSNPVMYNREENIPWNREYSLLFKF